MKKTILIIMALLSLLVLVGCEKSSARDGTIYGTWEAETTMSLLGQFTTNNGEPMTADVIYRFTFNEDGTGSCRVIIYNKYTGSIPDTTTGFTYTLDGDHLTLTSEDGNCDEFTVSFAGKKLLLDGRAPLELERVK